MSSQTLPQYLNYKIPAVMIHFDDGEASLYTEAFAYMNPLGMKGTAYIISPPFQNVTDAQMVEMDAAGWDMGNHTTTTTHLDTLTEEEQESAISGQKTVLDGLGLTRASSHVAYPSGAFNVDTLTAMAATSMLTGRSVYSTRETMRYYAANPFLLPCKYADAVDDPDDIIDHIEAILCTGAIASIVFHDIVSSGASGNQYNRADFREIVDWIYSHRLPTLTITQVYALMSGSIEYTAYW